MMCPMTTAPRGASPLDLVGDRGAVYRTLLAAPGSTTDDVAAAAGLPAGEARATLRAMAADGLVVPDGPAAGDHVGERWRAVPPQAALGDGVERLRADLEQAESLVAELADLARAAEPLVAGDLVEVLSGREAQARAIAHMEQRSRRSSDLFQTGANTVASVAGGITDDREPSRIPYRVVVDSAFLAEPAAVRALDERVAVGHRVRVVDHPLVKLAVSDGELAMVQVDPSTSLLLKGPLVRVAVELFETTWRRSRPYLREGAGPSRDDRQLLHLMISGLTDAAMASQLATSPRTVQRRIRALMDSAEVSTRLQLGWYALRHDWV
jgi:hypothetical protein